MRNLPGALALLVSVALPTGVAAAENDYIGAKACAACHTGGRGGDAHGVWERSAHAKAFVTLLNTDEKSRDGRKASERPECLKCHVTGGGDAKNVAAGFDVKEGITCEACHGAASAYRTVHAGGDLARSREAGLNPVDPAKSCLECHNKGCDKDFKFAEKWPLIRHTRPARK